MSRATRASSTCIISKRLNKHNVGLLPKGVSMQWQQTQIMLTCSMFSLLQSSPKSPKPLYIMKGIKEENEQQWVRIKGLLQRTWPWPQALKGCIKEYRESWPVPLQRCYHYWRAAEMRGSPGQLKNSKCCSDLQKRQKVNPGNYRPVTLPLCAGKIIRLAHIS